MMKNKGQQQMLLPYEAPGVEVMEVMVEQGFAASPVGEYPSGNWDDEIIL